VSDGRVTGFAVAAVVWLFGCGLARSLGLCRRDGTLAAVWAYLLGVLGSSLLAVPWLACAPGQGFWFLGILLAAGVLLCLRAPRAEAVPRPVLARAGRVERVCAGGLIALALAPLAAHLFVTSASPIVHGDEGHIWAMRAKMLFVHGPFSQGYGDDARNLAAGADYPLLASLVQTLAFGAVGDVAHVANRVVVQLAAPMLVLAVAAAGGAFVRPLLAAVLALVCAQNEAVIVAARCANADFLVALAMLLAADAILRSRAGEARWLRLAAAAMTACTLTKNEGVIAAAVLFVFAAVAARRQPPLRAAWPWLLLPVAAVGSQIAFNAYHGFANYLFVLASPEQLGLWERALITARALAALLVDPAHARLLLVLFLLAVVLAVPRLPRAAWLPLLLISTCAAALFAVYVVTPQGLQFQLDTSAGRVLFQLAGIAALGLAILLGHLWPRARGGVRQ
jgi:hypothetical protein